MNVNNQQATSSNQCLPPFRHSDGKQRSRVASRRRGQLKPLDGISAVGSSRGCNAFLLKPLNDLSIPRYNDFLQSMTSPFPSTVPPEDLGRFRGSQQSQGSSKKRSDFSEGKSQLEYIQDMSIGFEAEQIWKPKCFNAFVLNLFVTTKVRMNLCESAFDKREVEQERQLLQIFFKQQQLIKWTLCVISFLFYLGFLCFIINLFGQEGVNIAIPMNIFVMIIMNTVIANMNPPAPNKI